LAEASEDAIVLHRATRQAAALNHHLFDTLYHAVAIEHRAVLVTSDVRYYAKAKDIGSIRLLSEFVISEDR
jgi:predicted nucleic acid-binding protein